MTDEKGLAKTVLQQGKRIAAMEKEAETIKEAMGYAVNQGYLNTLCCQWIVGNLTEEQTAHFEAYLEENGVGFEKPEDPVDCSDTEEPKNH